MISAVHGMSAPLASMTVVAVASRSPERAAKRASAFRARAVTYDELPAGADAVVIATPPSRHAADTVQALEAGAVALVEKPLTTTLAEADAIVDAVDRTGRPVVYAENLAFSPVVTRAVGIARGLGTLSHLTLRTLQPAPEWGEFLEPSWGGGVLFDLGVHPIALALLVAGDDPLVALRAELDAGSRTVDEHALVELRFASSLVATVECSWRNASSEWDIQAASATGVMRAELMPEIALEHNGEPVALDHTRPGADARLEHLGYVAQLEAVAAAVGGRPSWCDARFGRGILDVVMAAYTSAGRDGAEVPLPYDGPRDRTPLECWAGP